MKIMATFDGSKFSESTLPQLAQMARMPGAEFVLVRVADLPEGQPQKAGPPPSASVVVSGATTVVQPADSPIVETKSQAVERTLAEMGDYLRDIATRLPPGPAYRFEARVSDDAAAEIIRLALVEQPDVIVIATHGRTGVVRALFGATAEEVVRSGVAPVLLVHPEEVRHRRAADGR
jgi:nucleotide-binding universal stress UspA family protein